MNDDVPASSYDYCHPTPAHPDDTPDDLEESPTVPARQRRRLDLADTIVLLVFAATATALIVGIITSL